MDTVQLDVTKEDSVADAVAHVLSIAGAVTLQRSDMSSPYCSCAQPLLRMILLRALRLVQQGCIARH